MRPHDIVSLTEIERYKTLFDVRGVVAALQMKFFYLNIRDKTTYKMTTTNGENNGKGIFIPEKILGLKDLNLTEKIIYSIYYFYTFNGDGSCHLTNETLATTLGITLVTFKKAKKRLKDKGYIKTNGGIKVEATGINFIPITGGKEIIPITEGINIIPITEGDKNYTTEGGKNYTSNRYKNYPHNNNNNNENNIKEKVKRKVEVMEETTTNTSTENELGFSNTSTATAEDIKRDYYNHINLNVPEWMIEMDEERNGEQPTNPSTFNYSREDEEREYKQHFKRMNYTGTNNTYPQRESEKVITPVPPCCPPSPSQTAKTAPQSARNTASGTTTHTEDKSPAEGTKTPSTKEERKAFTEKWHSIKNDMINGKYSPKQCEYLFKRVIKDIPQYFSGEWVETITKNWSNDYEGIKYQIRGYETYEMLKEIRASNETEKPQQYLNYHVDGLPD